MKRSVTLLVQMTVDVKDDDEPVEVDSVVRELEGRGWSVNVESIEPLDPDDEGEFEGDPGDGGIQEGSLG